MKPLTLLPKPTPRYSDGPEPYHTQQEEQRIGERPPHAGAAADEGDVDVEADQEGRGYGEVKAERQRRAEGGATSCETANGDVQLLQQLKTTHQLEPRRNMVCGA